MQEFNEFFEEQKRATVADALQDPRKAIAHTNHSPDLTYVKFDTAFKCTCGHLKVPGVLLFNSCMEEV